MHTAQLVILGAIVAWVWLTVKLVRRASGWFSTPARRHVAFTMCVLCAIASPPLLIYAISHFLIAVTGVPFSVRASHAERVEYGMTGLFYSSLLLCTVGCLISMRWRGLRHILSIVLLSLTVFWWKLAPDHYQVQSFFSSDGAATLLLVIFSIVLLVLYFLGSEKNENANHRLDLTGTA